MMKKTGGLSNLFSMVLLMMLTVSSFMIVLYQVNIYQTMKKENEISDKTHLPYAYLNQKLKKAEKIDIEDDVLVLTTDSIKTYIYLNEDSLMELTTLDNLTFNRQLGEKLFDVSKFKLNVENDCLNITYVVEDTEKNVFYSFRGLQHE